MMSSSITPYAGWKRCVRLANSEIELVATLEVGPRIIRLGFKDGPNEFAEYVDQLGKSGGSEYQGYGGHRLWAAPETKGFTDHPDNQRVEYREEGEWVVLTAQPESGTGLQKEIRMRLDPLRNRVRVIHSIANRRSAPASIAAWALSVMAPGGRAIFPQEPYEAHPHRLLPVRPLVLWSYTDMSDQRWIWGRNYIQLRQSRTASLPQKAGALNTRGWTAHVNSDRVFIKFFRFDANATYPDFGCNCEFFTNSRMLELETLGAITALNPGESVSHEERWSLHRGMRVGETDDEIRATLEPLVAQGLT